MFLTRADLQRLTGKTRYSAQRRALDALGIAYRVAATGEPLVREDDMSGRKRSEPRWDRITA